jgi:uncharacterized membrane protein
MSVNAFQSAPRPRIQGLSDLIFGLALSISALTLIGQQPTDTQAFAASLGAYAFSFLILISLWQAYSSVTSLLPAEASIMVDLNVVLLFLVSVEPYLFNELFAAQGVLVPYVSGAYSIDLTAMFFVLAIFYHSLTREENHLVPEALLGRYRSRRNLTFLCAFVLALSIYPYFANVSVYSEVMGGRPYYLTLRTVLWLVALLLNRAGRLITSTQAHDDTRIAPK